LIYQENNVTPPASLHFDTNFYAYLAAFILLPLSILYGAKFYMPGKYNDAFLSKEVTGCVKGISIVVVILHHLAGKISGPGHFFAFTRYGYLAVSIFFFLSGYSLMSSVIANPAYIDNFFRRRFTRVYFPVIAVNAITLVLYRFIYGYNWSAAGILKNITGVELIDPVLWFVNAILILYVVFYIAFRFFSRRAGIILVTAYSLFYFIICICLGYGAWWYNTAFCFPMGVIAAYKYKELTGFMQKNYMALGAAVIAVFCASFYMADWWPRPEIAGMLPVISAAACACMILVLLFKRNYTALAAAVPVIILSAYYILKRWNYPAYSTGFAVASSISCVLLMLVFLMKVKIYNSLWAFAGLISYEMYLVHMKVFNIYFSYLQVKQGYSIYGFLAMVIITAWVLNKLFNYINRQGRDAEAVIPVVQTADDDPV